MSMLVNPYSYWSGVLANATTLSTSWKSATLTLSGGNLTAAQSGTASYETVASLDAKTSGDWYFEATINGVGTEVSVGVTSYLQSVNNYIGQGTSTAISSGAYVNDGRLLSNGGAPTAVSSFTAGDVISIRYAAASRTIACRKNGGSWTTHSTPLSGTHPIFPAVSLRGSGASVTLNFGATPFAYSPPSGSSGWTQNTTRTGRYWRFHQYAGVNGANIAEIALRLTSGGSNNISGGTASASTTFGGLPASQAIDGNASTIWGASTGSGLNEWWQYDYGSGNSKANVEAVVQVRNDYAQYATNLGFIYSEDGTNWFPAFAREGYTWSLGETKTFTWG